MAELMASRDTDARVAREGFGLEVEQTDDDELWVYRPGTREDGRGWRHLKRYTTDPAQVVPLVTGIAEFGERRWVNLAHDPFKQVWMGHCYPGLMATEKTANLVLCSLLLAVADAAKGESDG